MFLRRTVKPTSMGERYKSRENGDNPSSVASILSVAFKYLSAEAVIKYQPSWAISFSYLTSVVITFELVLRLDFRVISSLADKCLSIFLSYTFPTSKSFLATG